MKRKQWTTSENIAVINLYFNMLDKATSGQTYNKAAMIREATTYRQNERYYGLRKPLADSQRSRGSIEAKLMNVSAVHRDTIGGETMDSHGYRALSNYQAALKELFIEYTKAARAA